MPYPTLQDVIDRFLRSKTNSADTRRTYRTATRRFLTFLEGSGLSPTSPANLITLDHAYDFINWLSNSYRTQKGQLLSKRSQALYMISVGQFYHYLVTVAECLKVDYVKYENFKDYLKDQAKYGKRIIESRLPKDDMIEAIIEAASQPPDVSDLPEKQAARRLLIWRRNLAAILVLYSSGMRVSELCALRRGDLDYNTEHHTAAVVGKGDTERVVYLSERAWQAIMSYLEHRHDGALSGALETKPLFCRHDYQAGDRRLPLSTHAIRDIFTRLGEETGIAKRFNMTPHTLRHYFATRFLEHTSNLALTQEVLGHEDPRTTRIYAHPNKEAIQKAHKEIFNKGREQSE